MSTDFCFISGVVPSSAGKVKRSVVQFFLRYRKIRVGTWTVEPRHAGAQFEALTEIRAAGR